MNGSPALVVVDMQNGFCHPNGNLYSAASKDAIDPVASCIESARSRDWTIVFTRDVHPPDQFSETQYYEEFDRWGEHVIEGSWGAEIVDELSVSSADHVVEKHTYDAFHQTELDGWFEARGITDLYFCGTLANVCVLHSASSAGLRDYRPVIIEDALGYIEESDRSYALSHAEWLFGELTTRAELFGADGQ